MAHQDPQNDIPDFDPFDFDQQKGGAQDQSKFMHYNVSQFKDFGLKEELLRAVKEAGFEHPTRVQTESLTNALQGEQLICQAKSGTGKTAVFVLTVLNSLNAQSDRVECIVIAHTRELAQQAKEEFTRLGKFLKDIRVECFYGGGDPVSLNIQTLKTIKPQIVVGYRQINASHRTPGRMRDLVVERRAMDLSKLRFFILDESDQMIDDLKMRNDIQDIFYKTPQDKQFMAFSATFTENSRTALKKFIADNKPVPPNIQTLFRSTRSLFLTTSFRLINSNNITSKFLSLQSSTISNRFFSYQILQTCKINQCIIFVKSADKADALVNELKKRGEESVRPLYGGNRQSQDHQKIRQKTYEHFRLGHFRLLVATNLMGRGIDIDKVNYVVNFDMPECKETYLHRVGRAGRQETNGVAISFVRSDDEPDAHKVSDEQVLADILKAYPDKLSSMPQDLTTLDKF